MKSLLVSALAAGVALGIDSAYYIGNYTASGNINLVPYPLGVCVPTGALSGFTYSIFTCDGDQISQKKFAMTDTTCSGTSTTVSLPKKTVPGLDGYAHCDGPSSYMVVNQYLSNCNQWKAGKAGSASTVIATNACTLAKVQGGVMFYSRSTCDGEGQLVKIYAADNTCTGTPVDQVPSSIECYFYGQQSGFNIYSATIKCVADGVVQRCADPLASYEAVVEISDAENIHTLNQTYKSIFEYATVGTTILNDSNPTTLSLNLGFCTQFEDVKYGTSVKNLGQTTLNAIDASKVCWTCLDYDCTNSTKCGTDDYCTEDEEQCTVATTTTTSVATSTSGATTTTSGATTTTSGATTTTDGTDDASPANAIYTSFALIMGLLLSWTLF